jgi:hypothetical protein
MLPPRLSIWTAVFDANTWWTLSRSFTDAWSWFAGVLPTCRHNWIPQCSLRIVSMCNVSMCHRQPLVLRLPRFAAAGGHLRSAWRGPSLPLLCSQSCSSSGSGSRGGRGRRIPTCKPRHQARGLRLSRCGPTTRFQGCRLARGMRCDPREQARVRISLHNISRDMRSLQHPRPQWRAVRFQRAFRI